MYIYIHVNRTATLPAQNDGDRSNQPDEDAATPA